MRLISFKRFKAACRERVYDDECMNENNKTYSYQIYGECSEKNCPILQKCVSVERFHAKKYWKEVKK